MFSASCVRSILDPEEAYWILSLCDRNTANHILREILEFQTLEWFEHVLSLGAGHWLKQEMMRKTQTIPVVIH